MISCPTSRGKHEGVAHVADSILDCAGITLDKGSHEYRVLCREALKGVIATTKVQLERMTGHYPEIRIPSGRGGREEISSLPSAAPRVKVEPVPLSEALAEFVKEHDASGHWRPKTREETEGVFRLLVGIVGDRDVSELDYKVISKFRDSLIRFPSNHTKRPTYREKTISEIVIMTALKPAASPLSVSSVNKHIIRTGAFLKWAVRRGYVAANYAEGLTITKKGKASEEREAYSTEDLVKLIQSLLAGGVKMRMTDPERFWIPILGLYSGARLNELCQLLLVDIKEDAGSGIICFDINAQGEKTLKNEASRRVVPIHPILLELGFMDYIMEMRGRGELQLWPTLKKKRGGFSQDFGKWFQRWNRQFVSKNPKRVFHSLRHSLADNLKQRGVDGNIIAEILGHSLGSMSLGRYGKGYEPKVLLDATRTPHADAQVAAVFSV
jgi:integrase